MSGWRRRDPRRISATCPMGLLRSALRRQRQIGEAADVGDFVAVFGSKRHRALIIDADVMLVGVADGAVKLERYAHGFLSTLAESCFDRRHHRRMAGAL